MKGYCAPFWEVRSAIKASESESASSEGYLRFIDGTLSLCPPMVEEKDSVVFVYKTTNPFIRAQPSHSYHQTSNTITLEVKISTYEFGGCRDPQSTEKYFGS